MQDFFKIHDRRSFDLERRIILRWTRALGRFRDTVLVLNAQDLSLLEILTFLVNLHDLILDTEKIYQIQRVSLDPGLRFAIFILDLHIWIDLQTLASRRERASPVHSFHGIVLDLRVA